MNVVLAAFLIGVIAGLRAMMAPTVVSWAAGLGTLHLEGTPLHFWGHAITRYVLSVAAIGELINDKLPKTPSRKVPPQFIIRVLTGSALGSGFGCLAAVYSCRTCRRRDRSSRGHTGRI